MERWKDVPGYEGIYQASNMGRIRTCEGKVTYSDRHGERHWKSRILKTRGKQASGYRVSLWKNKEAKDFLIARVVAMTWVDGYEDGFTVNHKNGNRYDNRITNLEWLSLADNIKHGFKNGLYPLKETTLINTKTKERLKFKSRSEASRFLGLRNGYISDRIIRYGDISDLRFIRIPNSQYVIEKESCNDYLKEA